MKSYIPNNINFRIVSSTALAKFKQDQAYDFNEINKHRDEVSSAAREVILLEYDHWFKWIVKLEKVFLLLSEDDKTDTLIQKTDVLLRTEMDDISEIMAVYTDFFSPTLTSFINFVHRYSVETLKVAFAETLSKNDMFCSFSKIVFYISLYLQQILLALQEIEFLLKNRENKIGKLYYSGWCKESCSVDGICPLAERSNYYSKNFGIEQFEIINMTAGEPSETCLNKIKGYNINIISITNQDKN